MIEDLIRLFKTIGVLVLEFFLWLGLSVGFLHVATFFSQDALFLIFVRIVVVALFILAAFSFTLIAIRIWSDEDEQSDPEDNNEEESAG